VRETGANADALGCELAGEVVRRFGRVRVRVTGTSMIPAIWPGDVVVVERRDVGGIELGEIVLAVRAGRLIAHRVVGGEKAAAQKHGATHTVARSILLRGDAQISADLPLRAEEVLGAVVAIERAGLAFEPARHLNLSERLLAAFARRSSFAARIFVRLHAILSARPERVALCQS